MSERRELRIERVAHGGHCVARSDGQVVFVRHCLPGELVIAEITGSGRRGRFLIADAVEIVEPAPGRVDPPCRLAGPGGCGGCDWQHADLPLQRELKAAVLTEQLARAAGVDWAGEVEAVAGDEDGLAWRSRVRYAVDPDHRVGFRRFHSHEVVGVDRCLIATRAVQEAQCQGESVTARAWPEGAVTVVGPGLGPGSGNAASQPGSVGGRRVPAVVDACPGAPERVLESAMGWSWQVPLTGFWQVHPGAAGVLGETVLAAVDGTVGAGVWDLYGGVGLFAGAIAAAHPDVRVHLVESDRSAAACARDNLADLPRARVHRAGVERWLAEAVRRGHSASAVVLDPPRKGAGAKVLALLDRTAVERIVYVACDPASLARDTRILADLGWRLGSVRAFDIFPMTQHFESVAVFDRA